MFDVLFHRVPWNMDKIRLYRDTDRINEVFIGEFWIYIRSGVVVVRDNNENGPNPRMIRRDLPKWSNRHSCWEYWYRNGGE